MAPTVAPVGTARTAGKFLEVGGSRYLVKGVSYGTFAPTPDGTQFPESTRVAADFGAMASHGFNTVRTYTVPSYRVLDRAADAGLRVIVGIPWAQHVAFLDDARSVRELRRHIVDTVRTVAAHPATLVIAVGNEIPPGVVRWHGPSRVERFLCEVYDEAKAASPDSLLAYVNFPPTEYLDLSCFDVSAFNVYLHREAELRGYLAHLHVVAGHRPLLLTEIGADSLSEGKEEQGALAAMQARVAFEEGICGAVTFAWTDEWWRGGRPVEDWRFGLTDVERRPKASLAPVADAYRSAGFTQTLPTDWPAVSVLVCARNAASTIGECLRSIAALDYPDYEVIVVDDGSTDGTGTIARAHDQVTVLTTEHVGLSAARNIALTRARGAIVAYTDADVRVDPQWLTYLVQPFQQSDVAGGGGPNVVPVDDPWVAQCVARAPGSPMHVLLDDSVAEHVPGCNMAFRRDVLEAMGGFDPVFHAAGDDVDVCWRLQARGHRIRFAPAALVWHRHRDTVRGFWRQQAGYGEAETWLMDAHPERFLDGQALWKGRIYSALPFSRAISRVRVNAGTWGTAAFPAVYMAQVPSLASVPHLMPWQMASAALAGVGWVCAMVGRPVAATLLLAAAALGLLTTFGRCAVYGWRSDLRRVPMPARWPRVAEARLRLMIAWLHVVQPIARAWGRFRGRLWPPPVGDRGGSGSVATRPDTRPVFGSQFVPLLVRRLDVVEYWSERWVDRGSVLSEIVERIQSHGVARAVDAHDPWQQDRDLAVATGRWGWIDLRTLLEEHDGGRCLLRVAARHRLTPWGVVSAAALLGAPVVVAVFSTTGALVTAAMSTLIAATGWRRAARIHAGVRAIVSQVASEYGLRSMTTVRGGVPSESAAPAVPGTVRPRQPNASAPPIGVTPEAER